MDKKLVLSQIKNTLHSILQEMNNENMVEKISDMRKFMNFAEMLHHLPNIESEDVELEIVQETVNAIQQPNETSKNVFQDAANILVIDEENLNEDIQYVFERKIRGGFINGLDDGYVVPEKMVRDVGLGHLDKIVVTEKSPGKNNRNNYKFTIVEKGHKDLDGRVELHYCLVEKSDFGEMVIRKSGNGLIKLDDVPFTFIVSGSDVTTYKLEDGDIVDIAYIDDNPIKTVKVVHKYEIEEMSVGETKTVTAKPKKVKEKSEKVAKDYGVDTDLIKGKKIIVVGCGNRHADYIDAFEGIGAEFIGCTGDEQPIRIEAMIDKADAAVIAIGECSHAASTLAVRYCKEKGIPFSTSDRNGVQSIILNAEKALQKTLITA